MAKHLYSPELESLWQGFYDYLRSEADDKPIDLANVIAILSERDRSLEGKLLGDLVVNSVTGTIGTVTPPQERQIGWLLNTGFVTGTVTNPSGYFPIVYADPFPTDTAFCMFVSTISDPVNFLGFTAQVVQGTPTRTGFSIAVGNPGDPVAGCYAAVGF